MKVAFDATTAAFEKKTGTGVYCYELIKAYQERFTDDRVFHTYRLARRFKGRKNLVPLSTNSRREILLDPITYIKGFKYDIFHGLNSRLPNIARTINVATIHDLFSIFGQFSPPAFREDQAKKLSTMIARANHIIVPASFTKQELVNKLNMDENKITVVGEGVREVFLKDVPKGKSKSAVKQKYGFNKPYLLFVGTLEKRKNVVGVVRAYKALKEIDENVPDLVLVGNEGFQYDEIANEIEFSGMTKNIRRLGFVTEEDLADLYRACEAFLMISWEEGFGIPIIEAMACGAAVISSDTTSLPEAGGGFSWLVSPGDIGGVAKIISNVLKGSDSTTSKILSGQKYARSLTWTRVAEETRDVYVKLLGHSSP